MNPKEAPLQRENLIKAFHAALNAPCPHERSPAFALQVAYRYTKHVLEDDLQWLRRFVAMTGVEYEPVLGWDISDGRWSDTPDMIVAGQKILNDCVRWLENNWDLARHPRDRFEYREDDAMANIDSNAIERIHQYLQPISGEVMRYRWWRRESGKRLLCTLDVWHAPHGEFRWCFTVHDDVPRVVFGPPTTFSMIAAFIAPAVVPSDAECAPFIPHADDEEVE
jgi:hypothetical protein